jgi:hypothetical protein
MSRWVACAKASVRAAAGAAENTPTAAGPGSSALLPIDRSGDAELDTVTTVGNPSLTLFDKYAIL